MMELYQFEECPYCSKVRTKLTELGVDYVIRNVPKHLAEKREFLEKISGSSQVPTLVDLDNGIVMKESDDIIAHLEKRFNNK